MALPRLLKATLGTSYSRSVAGEGCHRHIPLDARANAMANCAVRFEPPLIDIVGLFLSVKLGTLTRDDYTDR